MKLLIAEDHALIQKALVDFITDNFDHTVLVAENGEEALELVQDEKPDLVLTDYYMPNMNGIVLMRKIQGLPDVNDVPVMLYSGTDCAVTRERALEAGAIRFFPKPLDIMTLVDAISEFESSHT